MIDPRDPQAVIAAFDAGRQACLTARCRRGACDVIGAPGTLIATGDLHDNPVHFASVVEMAGLGEDAPGPSAGTPVHVTLHELIHSDRLINGVDLSYRALLKAASLKARAPERVHILLANHELAQIAGAGIVKDGVNVVQTFNEGVEYVFGGDTDGVLDALGRFIRALPLALRVTAAGGDLLCAHSLPAPELLDRFDPGVLDRDLTEDDYIPRRGSAHLMVWGRDHTPEQLASLAQTWNVGAFILGHEKAEQGWFAREPNCLVLNTDHERGCIATIDLSGPLSLAGLKAGVRRLSPG